MLEAIILKNRVAGAMSELSAPPAAKAASAKKPTASTKRKAHTATAHR